MLKPNFNDDLGDLAIVKVSEGMLQHKHDGIYIHYTEATIATYIVTYYTSCTTTTACFY